MDEQLTYRPITMEDFEDYYNLKCDPKNISWGGWTEVPNRDNLTKWLETVIASEHRSMYLVYIGDKCVAYFGINFVEGTMFEALSSGVLTEFTGMGIGTMLVKWRDEIIESLGGKSIITWIAEDNIASYRRFEKLGYARTKEKEIRNLPLLGGEHVFYKWIKEIKSV